MPEDRHPGTPGGGSGADVKSGIELNVTCGTQVSVTFATAFATVPEVTVSIGDILGYVDIPFAWEVTTAGFTLGIHKGHGGGTNNHDVNWIATDAGDP